MRYLWAARCPLITQVVIDFLQIFTPNEVKLTNHVVLPEHSSDFHRAAETAQGFSPLEVYSELREHLDRASGIDESERDSFEWTLFSHWAHERGIRCDTPASEGRTQGGHEHFILSEEPHYIKCTKWDLAGYVYDPDLGHLRNATVCEYLLRLHYQDELFLSDTEILGIAVKGNSRAILTRQKPIEGRMPSEQELHQFLAEMGAKKLNSGDTIGYQGAVYSLFDYIIIADVRADNFRLTTGEKGKTCLAAFDLIISVSPEMLLASGTASET